MILRVISILVGCIFILIGVIVAILPVPLGIPMIMIGLALLAPESPFIRRTIARLRKRYPAFDGAMRRAHGRVPRFVQIFIERTRPENFHEDGRELDDDDRNGAS